jgi:hypothetical protein
VVSEINEVHLEEIWCYVSSNCNDMNDCVSIVKSHLLETHAAITCLAKAQIRNKILRPETSQSGSRTFEDPAKFQTPRPHIHKCSTNEKQALIDLLVLSWRLVE